MKPALLFLILALTSISALAGDLQPIILIKSPDHAESFVYGDVSGHKLFWSEKEQKMFAVVTVDNSRYATSTERPGQDTFRFYLPGVVYEPRTKQYVVHGPNGEIVPFAETKKELFLTSINPVHNAVVRVFRTRGKIEVNAEIYNPKEVAQEEAADKAAQSTNTNETKKLDVNNLFGN